MKTPTTPPVIAALFVASLALLFTFPTVAHAQIAISNTNTYTENFNGMGTNTNASLPTGWKMSAAGSGTTGTFWTNSNNSNVVSQAASSGSPSSGGRYNWGFSNQTNNRAIGFMSSSGYAEPNSIMVAFTNTTGLTITNLAVSFDLIRFRINAAAISNVFYISDNSTNWGIALSTNTWATGTSAYFFNTNVASTNIQSVSVTNAINITNGGMFYMMWTFDAAGSSNSQGIGLDNFSMNIFTSAAAAGNFWVGNDTTLGGSGTWTASGGTSWRTTDTDGTGGAFDATALATFGGATSGTVTVSGAVSPQAGIAFKTTGYVVQGDDINLAGTSISSNTITTDASVTATIDSKLSGSNGLTKAGTGTLILGGTNDYTGGTLVSAGRLVGTTTSLQGAITNNAAVTFDQTTNGTYSSAMSGSGSLRKNGAGTVTLSGANSYSGGTEVAAGRLVGDTHSLQGAITNNAAVTFDQTTNGTYSSAMSGSGSLTKSGAGTVTLSGANSYSGGTEVAAGRLVGDTHSLQGAITNNAAVTFDQSTNGTYSSAMGGSGSLRKDGSGTVTVSGANSYSGGTEVAAGRLVGDTHSLQGAITNNAAVTFDQTTNGTYSSAMSGSGSITKSGAGTVTFSGGNSYAGGTTVNGGTLIADNSTALGTGSVTISNGSVFAKDTMTVTNDFVIGTASSLTTNNFTVSWNFGTSSGNASPSSSDANGFTISAVSQGNNNGTTDLLTTSSSSSGYTGASGQYNAGAAARTGALNTNASGSAYFEFTLELTDAESATLQDVTFGSRSTSTGPQAYGIYDTDDLSTALASDTMAATSTWDLQNAAFTDTAIDESGTTFRIYGYDGTGSPGANTANWRIDDLTLTGQSVNVTEGSGSGTIGINEAGEATFTGNITVNNDATFTAAASGTADFSGVISGSGAISKSGGGTVTFSGSSTNTQTGKVTVNEGTLELAKASGTTAIAGNLEIKSSAKLLLSASGQVADTSAVTLSGGTIERAGGVSETFGNLNLTAASFLDYGTAHDPGDEGTLTFGTYTPSSLLTVNNFFEGNKLVFSSNIGSDINNTNLFKFNNGFTTNWSGSTFTITAIPEPAAYVAGIGLLGVLLWPKRRRLLKDAKSILGLRPPARDRLTKP